MLRAIGEKIIRLWVLLVILTGVMVVIGWRGDTPVLQQHIQSSCDTYGASLLDRRQQLVVPLVPPGVCVLSSVWSPDGEHIAFARHRAQRFNFGVSPPDLSVLSTKDNTHKDLHDGEATFGIGYNFFETRIQWSPNGEWILYTVRADANDLYLWVVRADGSAIYDYTDYIEHEPAVFFWSADSQYIYIRMVEFDLQTQAIYLRKLALEPTPEPIKITPVPFEETVWVYPTRRGGEMLTFTDEGLWLANLDTGAQQFVTDTSIWVYSGSIAATWTLDREWIALLGATGEEQALLRIVRLDGRDIREFSIDVEKDRSRFWYISDFNWPHSIRLVSPDWSGYICDIDLSTEAITCIDDFDARRIVAPPQP